MEPFPSLTFKVLIWIFATTTMIYTDGSSTQAHTLGFAAAATPIYSSRPNTYPQQPGIGHALSAIHFWG